MLDQYVFVQSRKKARLAAAAVAAAEAPPLSPVHTRPRAKILRASVNMQPGDVATSSSTASVSGAEFAAGTAMRKREIEENEERLQTTEDL